eukprot:1326907-Rhodomonas_salina.1
MSGGMTARRSHVTIVSIVILVTVVTIIIRKSSIRRKAEQDSRRHRARRPWSSYPEKNAHTCLSAEHQTPPLRAEQETA